MSKFISKTDWESWKAAKKSAYDYYTFVKKYGVKIEVGGEEVKIISEFEMEQNLREFLDNNGWKESVSMIANSNIDAWLDDEAFCLYSDGKVDVVNDEILIPAIEKYLVDNGIIKNISKDFWESWRKENKGRYREIRHFAVEFDIDEVYDNLMTNDEIDEFIVERMECDGWSWQSIQICLSGIDVTHRYDDFFHLDSEADLQVVKDWDYYADIVENALKNMFNW